MNLVKIREIRNLHAGDQYYELDDNEIFLSELEALKSASNLLRFHFLTTGCSEWTTHVNFRLGECNCCSKRKLSDVFLVEGFKITDQTHPSWTLNHG